MFGTPPVGGLLKGRQKAPIFRPFRALSRAHLYQGFAALTPGYFLIAPAGAGMHCDSKFPGQIVCGISRMAVLPAQTSPKKPGLDWFDPTQE